jgi:hypothetical protein
MRNSEWKTGFRPSAREIAIILSESRILARILKPGVMSGKWKKQEMLKAKESYSTFLPMG